jgi:uncharacterized membrane protein
MADSARVRAIDWLRGLAVLVMMQTHALSLLRPDLHTGPLFSRLQWIDGLVAPAFILAAGFSMALTQVRAAASASTSPGARGRRLRRTLRRLGEIYLVATLMQWMWFPLLREPKWLLRIDILMCIALSLTLALPILVLLAPRPRALSWVSLALAALVFGVAPLGENVPGVLNHFLSHKSGSMFPLLPWAGYVYLGAAVGAATAAGGSRSAALWLLGIAIAGIAIWSATPFFQGLYGPHDFWVTNPANCARRFTQVSLIALVLLGAETLFRGAWQRSLPIRFVEVFGASSLAAYFFHEALLFYRIRGLSFHALWGDRATWPQYWGLVAPLIAMTFVLTWLADRAYQRLGLGGRAPVSR